VAGLTRSWLLGGRQLVGRSLVLASRGRAKANFRGCFALDLRPEWAASLSDLSRLRFWFSALGPNLTPPFGPGIFN
jgi:hypothetical protein